MNTLNWDRISYITINVLLVVCIIVSIAKQL